MLSIGLCYKVFRVLLMCITGNNKALCNEIESYKSVIHQTKSILDYNDCYYIGFTDIDNNL